jgi:hypothetical protein
VPSERSDLSQTGMCWQDLTFHQPFEQSDFKHIHASDRNVPTNRIPLSFALYGRMGFNTHAFNDTRQLESLRNLTFIARDALKSFTGKRSFSRGRRPHEKAQKLPPLGGLVLRSVKSAKQDCPIISTKHIVAHVNIPKIHMGKLWLRRSS